MKDKKISELLVEISEKDSEKLKYEFMPEAIEFIEKPSANTSLRLIIILSIMLLAGFLWSFIGEIEEVVTFRGSVKSGNQIESIYSSIQGKIDNIEVENGDFVKQGEVLILMDLTVENESLKVVEEEFKKSLVENELYNKLLNNEEIVRTDYPKLIVDYVLLMDKSNQNKYRQNLLANILNGETKLNSLKLEKISLENEIKAKTIIANKDGYINDLVDKTRGSIVGNGEHLLTIVPRDEKFVVEGYVKNNDIGMVTLEQECTIKVDAYSYQKNGALKGKISKISDIAITDERKESVYPVEISISKTNEDISLKSGMNVTIEAVKGKKKIIGFLLDPVMKHIDKGIKNS